MRDTLSVVGFALMVGGLVGLFYAGSLFLPVPAVIAVQAFAAALMLWARVTFGKRSFHASATPTAGGLVNTGPYRYLRHPIYTGLLVAFIGSAMAIGEWRGVFAVLIAWWTLWRKLRLEERWMAERFGERYEAYCRRVPALVPFWR